MNKTVRIVLYIFSFTIAVATLALMMIGIPGKGKVESTFLEMVAENRSGITGNPEAQAGELEGDEDGSTSGQDTGQGKADGTSEGNAGDGDWAGAEGATTDSADKELTASKETEDTVIIFAGDVLFGSSFTANYDKSGIEGVIDDDLLDELIAADIVMVNNEFPFSDRGTQMEEKQFTFECLPSYAAALSEMGVDIVTLANNHTLDYGREALSDTFETLDNINILYAGAGETVERAEAFQVIEANGRKYGFVAASRVLPVASWNVESNTPGIFSCYDDTRLTEVVAEAKKECDFVAVYPHWGVEYEAYPESYQTKIATDCIEAGADLIVGSHTHCLQGVEWIEDIPVFYSLGNFMFGSEIDRSAIVKVTIASSGDISYEMLPVCASAGITSLADEKKAEQILTYIDSISTTASVSTGVIVKR